MTPDVHPVFDKPYAKERGFAILREQPPRPPTAAVVNQSPPGLPITVVRDVDRAAWFNSEA